MNNLRKITWVGLIVILLFPLGRSTSEGQDKTELPSPPFVADVPDFCQWTMTVAEKNDQTTQPAAPPVTQTGKAAPASRSVVKMVCTRTKNIKRDVIFYNNGNHSEVWYIDNLVVVGSANGGFSVLSPGTLSAKMLIPDVSTRGFLGVDWITSETFHGKMTLENGMQAYAYHGVTSLPTFNLTTGSTTMAQGTPIAMQAMIAVDSRLPLVVTRGDLTFTFTYQPPPTEVLQVPDGIQKRITSIQQRVNYIMQMKAAQDAQQH